VSRPLSPRMLSRRVRAWGPWGPQSIIVVFEDGKLAIVNPAKREYTSVRAWNPAVRAELRAAARHAWNGTLAELLAKLRG